MSNNIREKASEVLKGVPPLGQQINSDGPTAALFTKLTGGVTHATLVKNWAEGGKLTTCNAFVGWFGNVLGSQKYLGRFDVETYLPTIGKGHAWVKSTQDTRPKYGDICRHTKFHVGISLDFEGDFWNHADSGQGGSSAGRDIIKRIRSKDPFDYKKLQGWIDLELYFGSSAQTAPTPDWLPGWWKVMWRGQAYYYYFERNNKVKWTQIQPPNITKAPLAVSDTGSFTFEFPDSVTIRWGASGSVEKLSKSLAAQNVQMRGTWNDADTLNAEKM
ncbi:hypothetical protein [Methyloglobulus sp.]|uniref:hypothetical protein n=1 Tax=Methyloglobulus sp. TaxID=2518622 RepID=UPI00398900A2